jgi:hypothetical protein
MTCLFLFIQAPTEQVSNAKLLQLILDVAQFLLFLTLFIYVNASMYLTKHILIICAIISAMTRLI